MLLFNLGKTAYADVKKTLVAMNCFQNINADCVFLSGRTKGKSKSHQYCALLPFAFKAASILIAGLAKNSGILLDRGRPRNLNAADESFFPFEITRCPEVQSQLRTGRTSWTQVHPTLSGKVRSEVVFVEELQPKRNTSDMEARRRVQ